MSYRTSQVIDITYTDLTTLKSNSDLVRGATYYITDRQIYIVAIEDNKLEPEAIKVFRGVKESYYTPSVTVGLFDSHYTGIYGQGITAGSYPVSDGLFGGDIYYAIWGGRMWERNIVGTDQKDSSYPDLNLDTGGWTMIATSNNTYYQDYDCIIKYDLDGDAISYIKDPYNNEFYEEINVAISYNDFRFDFISTVYKNRDIYIYTGPITIITGIGFNVPSGVSVGMLINNFRGSTNKASIFNNANTGAIYNNANTGAIYNNANIGGIFNNANTGTISRNANTGAIYNNANTGAIYNNANTGTISYNANNGSISYNANNGSISYNSSDGANTMSIHNNNNNGSISYNNNTANINIYNNVNNGNIGSSTSPVNRAANITDAQTNK